MTLTIDLALELEAELRDEAAKFGMDPNGFVLSTMQERLRGSRLTAPSVSKEEADLLLKISAGLPEATWKRHRALDKKRRAETLTPEEHEELLRINGLIEGDGVQRIGHAAELAKLRGSTLPETMKALGIGPRRRALAA